MLMSVAQAPIESIDPNVTYTDWEAVYARWEVETGEYVHTNPLRDDKGLAYNFLAALTLTPEIEELDPSYKLPVIELISILTLT